MKVKSYKEVDIECLGNVMTVHVTGKLEKSDYETFMPVAEEMIAQHGKIRILFIMHDFHGWTTSAAWQDLKFAWKHFRDIEKLGIVGETKWEKGMAFFCKPFTLAKTRYFDIKDLDQAREWIAD